MNFNLNQKKRIIKNKYIRALQSINRKIKSILYFFILFLCIFIGINLCLLWPDVAVFGLFFLVVKMVLLCAFHTFSLGRQILFFILFFPLETRGALFVVFGEDEILEDIFGTEKLGKENGRFWKYDRCAPSTARNSLKQLE